MSDWYEKYIASKKKDIISSGKSLREEDVYCPNCGNEVQNYWKMLPNHTETWVELECYDCDKKFEIKWNAVYSTRVVEKKNDDE